MKSLICVYAKLRTPSSLIHGGRKKGFNMQNLPVRFLVVSRLYFWFRKSEIARFISATREFQPNIFAGRFIYTIASVTI